MLPNFSALALHDREDIGMWPDASDPKTGQPLPELPAALRQHVLELMGRNRGKQALLKLDVCAEDWDGEDFSPFDFFRRTDAAPANEPNARIAGRDLTILLIINATRTSSHGRALYPGGTRGQYWRGAQRTPSTLRGLHPDDRAAFAADNMSVENLQGVVGLMRREFQPTGWELRRIMFPDQDTINVLQFAPGHDIRARFLTPMELRELVKRFTAQLREFAQRVRWLLYPVPRVHELWDDPEVDNCFVEEVYVLRPDAPVADASYAPYAPMSDVAGGGGGGGDEWALFADRVQELVEQVATQAAPDKASVNEPAEVGATNPLRDWTAMVSTQPHLCRAL